MKYGDLPTDLGVYNVNCNEMLFYQYLPIKLNDSISIQYEERLKCFEWLISSVANDFIKKFGFNEYKDSYIYLTAKHLFQSPNCSFNRPGYHSDGFLTDDINFIWSNNNGTIFNKTEFNLTLDDNISIKEMQSQALKQNEVYYKEGSILRLDQFNIHKVKEIETPCLRTFVKVSFSKDKYDLIGNSHNHLLNYKWDMKERKPERNIPQSVIK